MGDLKECITASIQLLSPLNAAIDVFFSIIYSDERSQVRFAIIESAECDHCR